MKLFVLLLLASYFTFAATSFAEEKTLTTNDGFNLKASFYQSNKESNRAVLLLHQCNYNRTMYNDIAILLSGQGIHALSFDFRGFGDSSNVEFNVDKVRALSKEERGNAWRKMSSHWPSDVQLAYDYLKTKLPENAVVGVIGASCGGSQAITLAENNPVEVIGFFSSGQSVKNIARYKKTLGTKPTLIIASEDDKGTYESAQKIFKTTTNANSKFIAFKGEEHGYPLLDTDPQLASYIVAWLDQQLIK